MSSDGLSRTLSILKESFLLLKRNQPLILAAATSFFSTFAISPIVVILINVFDFYFKNEEMRVQLIRQLEEMFGGETAGYIEGIVRNVNKEPRDWIISVIGFLFLLFIATTLLKVVRQAMHKIWSIKRKDVSGLRYNFKERSISALIIVFTGILILFTMILDTSLALLYNYLREELPSLQVFLIRSLNIVFSLIVGTLWFGVLFKLLPDARMHWRIAFAGGLVTSVFFSAGKWILGKLLLYNLLANIFGPSASFVLILLFIFYSSFILYFGAAFTYIFGARAGMPVHAGKYSEAYEIKLLPDDEPDSVNSEKGE